MRRNGNLLGCALFAVLIIVIAAAALQDKNKEAAKENEYTYKEFIEMAGNGEVAEVFLSDNSKLEFTLSSSEAKYKTDNPRIPELKEKLLLYGINVVENGGINQTVQSLASILLFAGAFFFVSRSMNRNNMKSAMALNPASIKSENANKLSFNDIAGNDEAKDGMSDIVDFIKNPDKYAVYGARMPRGIIFYGPPGTGKTLMAKAIAGEAGVPFYAVSGSDFVQMFVGVGASRVRDLFKKARESKKAVIFIDEIDALGKKRGTQAGGNDERDQTLNALLTEMSGFDSSDGIIVIAATNRLDTLDEALLRPGRFDRQVEIGLPDINARERILKLHSKEKPLADGIDLRKLAADTVYFSGAMLENLLNEAAIFAVKRDGNTGNEINGIKKAKKIEAADIEKAFYTVIAGSEKKDRSNIKEAEKNITAYHEAGHALVSKLAAPENKVTRITIIPSTKGAGGFCINIPPDKLYYTKDELEAQIMVSLAGRAAEELIFGSKQVTTGASNDIEKASAIARDYVIKYGMGEKSGLLNPTVFNEKDNAVGECRSLLEKLYTDTKALLSQRLDSLISIAQELLIKESICEEELDAILL